MITPIPDFANKADLFDWLKLNEKKLIAEKVKFKNTGDVVKHAPSFISGTEANKSADPNLPKDELQVKAIINTTNLLDSYFDVHIPGLWDKSLSENKYMYHLQEHKTSFDKVIAEGSAVKAYVQNFTWKELGFDYTGTTQALVFDSTIKAVDNPMMFSKYQQGKVRQHSVGMQYIKVQMAIDSNHKDDEKYKQAWDKYYPQIANKEMADKYGFFFAVTEAKANEGSAVMFGANYATPTLETKEHGAAESTPNKPEQSTSKFFQTIINNLNKK
jgi:hypothetical protein